MLSGISALRVLFFRENLPANLKNWSGGKKIEEFIRSDARRRIFSHELPVRRTPELLAAEKKLDKIRLKLEAELGDEGHMRLDEYSSEEKTSWPEDSKAHKS